MRYRLRLHLQEIDLGGREVVIGRGSMCQVTIDDPMLSRRHVRIDFSGPRPTLEDLHSRNGTQLNGRPVVGRATLQDGDRIRIGTQELVFLVSSVPKKDLRTTSGLTYCVGCAVPYPSASAQCPHCGAVATEQGYLPSARDVTSSGWTFYLLSQVVSRALEQGRLADAERMMSRGITELHEQLERGVAVERSHIVALGECAARIGCMLRSSRWLQISAKLYGRVGETPSLEVLALIDRLPADVELVEVTSDLRNAGSSKRRAV